LLEEQPELKSKCTEVAKLLGEEWKETSEEDKAVWRAKAVEDVERYNAECEAAGIEIKPKKQKREGGEKEAAEKKPNEKEPKSKLADIAPAKSAVQLYRAENRERVAMANQDADVGTVIQILVEEFEQLDGEERQKYEDLALQDMERFNGEHEAAKKEKDAIKAEREAAKAAKAAEKEAAKVAKAAEREAAKAAKEATKADKAKKTAGKKTTEKTEKKKPPAERELKEWEAEILSTLESMKKAGVAAEQQVLDGDGKRWQVKLKVRGPDKDGKPSKARDILVIAPTKQKFDSVMKIKKHLGVFIETKSDGDEEPATEDTEGAVGTEEGAEEAAADGGEGKMEEEAEEEEADEEEAANDEE